MEIDAERHMGPIEERRKMQESTYQEIEDKTTRRNKVFKSYCRAGGRWEKRAILTNDWMDCKYVENGKNANRLGKSITKLKGR